jgi:predicted GH43/DUF377 family glycosyl hydrolase
MPADDLVIPSKIVLRPDPARVVIRPFIPAEDPPAFAAGHAPRAQRVADRVLALGDAEMHAELARVIASLTERHHDIEHVLLRRFHEVNGLLIGHCTTSDAQMLLIGAYFSEEYAFEAAALFNPSIVAHPDQRGVDPGALRFVLSLRGVGEGHISSIAFRTGVCAQDGTVMVNPPSLQAISPRIEDIPDGAPDDPGVRLFCENAADLSQIVIFPVTRHQQHGVEDLRMVRFTDDDGNVSYLGTYTAFSGLTIRQELLRTIDFKTFELNALRGDATANKGMALFPRRINGRYAMLGRQDHENVWYLTSDNLYAWNGGTKILPPLWSWEFIQMGNGGSPIEIDEGWLVITHGVGAVRTYCIGACLLDRDDPTKLLGRVVHPVIRPSAERRYGYVPNVAYTCGAMVHGRTLVLPYALADSFTTFATVPLDALLAAMT